MEMDAAFWRGLLGLAPLLIYIVLVFRGTDILAATAMCVGIGAVLSGQTPITFGAALADALGSFLALVGLIIMLGRGLGYQMLGFAIGHIVSEMRSLQTSAGEKGAPFSWK